MGNLLCMGLFLDLAVIPSPRSLHCADHGLAAGVDVDMLDRDLLLALAAMLVQRVQQSRPGAGELVRLVQVFLAPLEGLLADHGAAVALHGSVVGREELCCHHALQLVPGCDPAQSRHHGTRQPVTVCRVRVAHPERPGHLVGEHAVPIVGQRPTEFLEFALPVLRIIGINGN
ncbi:hypothetical protein [Tropicimonas sp. IMCC6043]|uniref:hypothetical protein n=1 Tax=Tropicimonas sp. IMCC6043 TaxID=2510645 RepID=UPI00273991E7|nr:hypothetical protein [Tropicimonas sp. IMCC6043]